MKKNEGVEKKKQDWSTNIDDGSRETPSPPQPADKTSAMMQKSDERRKNRGCDQQGQDARVFVFSPQLVYKVYKVRRIILIVERRADAQNYENIFANLTGSPYMLKFM